jgi:hypothetical protein
MTGKCRSCGADIIWAPLAATGGLIPLDVQTELAPAEKLVAYNSHSELCRVLTRSDVRDAQLADPHVTFHKSHFATCPEADKWRKPVRRT